jgi:NhaA family Na+:H+ antiporter
MPDPEVSYSRLTSLPERPIQRFQRPLIAFTHIESASGIVLLICTGIALIAANSPYADAYAAFWNQEFSVSVESFELAYPLWYWVNDALMPIFFFLIGLEIKRELVIGELSDRKKVVLPVAAAIGGIVAPVLFFFAFDVGEAGARGWAVPMATDIAFVVGCLSLLGRRVPYGLTVLMLSLAIVDDLAAVLVIAIFYTTSIKGTFIAGAFLGLIVVAAMNRVGVRNVWIYVAVGSFVWLCTLKSGIHPTTAGVVLGLMCPAQPWLGGPKFLGFLRHTDDTLRKEDVTLAEAQVMVADLAFASREAVAPLTRIERALHPWTAFAIMPIFALANAGVPIDIDGLGEPIGLAIAAGLFFGKSIGIFGASWLAVTLGWATPPLGVTWPILAGAAFLGGIGFTMALFIASLGLAGDLLVSAKIGVLLGSFVSAAAGMAILTAATKKL